MATTIILNLTSDDQKEQVQGYLSESYREIYNDMLSGYYFETVLPAESSVEDFCDRLLTRLNSSIKEGLVPDNHYQFALYYYAEPDIQKQVEKIVAVLRQDDAAYLNIGWKYILFPMIKKANKEKLRSLFLSRTLDNDVQERTVLLAYPPFTDEEEALQRILYVSAIFAKCSLDPRNSILPGSAALFPAEYLYTVTQATFQPMNYNDLMKNRDHMNKALINCEKVDRNAVAEVRDSLNQEIRSDFEAFFARFQREWHFPSEFFPMPKTFSNNEDSRNRLTDALMKTYMGLLKPKWDDMLKTWKTERNDSDGLLRKVEEGLDSISRQLKSDETMNGEISDGAYLIQLRDRNVSCFSLRRALEQPDDSEYGAAPKETTVRSRLKEAAKNELMKSSGSLFGFVETVTQDILSGETVLQEYLFASYRTMYFQALKNLLEKTDEAVLIRRLCSMQRKYNTKIALCERFPDVQRYALDVFSVLDKERQPKIYSKESPAPIFRLFVSDDIKVNMDHYAADLHELIEHAGIPETDSSLSAESIRLVRFDAVPRAILDEEAKSV